MHNNFRPWLPDLDPDGMPINCALRNPIYPSMKTKWYAVCIHTIFNQMDLSKGYILPVCRLQILSQVDPYVMAERPYHWDLWHNRLPYKCGRIFSAQVAIGPMGRHLGTILHFISQYQYPLESANPRQFHQIMKFSQPMQGYEIGVICWYIPHAPKYHIKCLLSELAFELVQFRTRPAFPHFRPGVNKNVTACL